MILCTMWWQSLLAHMIREREGRRAIIWNKNPDGHTGGQERDRHDNPRDNIVSGLNLKLDEVIF